MKAKLCHRPHLWMVDVGSPAHSTAIAEPQALCMCTGMIISVSVLLCKQEQGGRREEVGVGRG